MERDQPGMGQADRMKVRLAFCLALALLCMGAATITDVSLKRTILTSNQVVGVFVDGQVPVWNAAMGAWSNSTPATSGGGGDTNSTYLLLIATNGLPNAKRLIADGVTTRLLTNGGDVVITNTYGLLGSACFSNAASFYLSSNPSNFLSTNAAQTLVNNGSNSLYGILEADLGSASNINWTFANSASNTVRALIPTTGTIAASNVNAFVASYGGFETNTTSTNLDCLGPLWLGPTNQGCYLQLTNGFLSCFRSNILAWTINTTNGFFGIGTNAPQSRIHGVTTIPADGSILRLDNTNGQRRVQLGALAFAGDFGLGTVTLGDVTPSISNYALESDGAACAVNGTSSVAVNIGNTAIATFKSNGLGIGTTTPRPKLEVQGQTYSSGLALSNINGTASTSITAGATLSSNVSVYTFSSGGGSDMTLSLATNANYMDGTLWQIALGVEGTNVLNLTPTNFAAPTADKIYRSTNIVMVPGTSLTIQKQGTNFNIVSGLPSDQIGSVKGFDLSQAGICTNQGSFYVQCNGQTLADAGSPLNGKVIRNLNSNNQFLRGNTTSGGTGGAATHTHTLPDDTGVDDDPFSTFYISVDNNGGGSTTLVPTGDHIHSLGGSTGSSSTLPPYTDMVWIMRVK